MLVTIFIDCQGDCHQYSIIENETQSVKLTKWWQVGLYLYLYLFFSSNPWLVHILFVWTALSGDNLLYIICYINY